MTPTDRTKKWQDGLANFSRTVENLELSVATPVREKRDLSGIIKDFELAYELAWKQLRTLLQIKGHQADGARDIFKKAWQLGILQDESLWLNIIDDQNATVHTYDENKARQMADRIKSNYFPAFKKLLDDMRSQTP